jgi:protein phosphatase
MAVWRKGSTKMYIAGVGDSRAYLVRPTGIKQLTVDHSLAQALVEAKTISPEEAREHRFRNVLWKYLGTKEVGDGPEVRVEEIQPGDRFLLCTDGLSGVVGDDQLHGFILEQTDMQNCADGLGQLALDSGSRDNVSCIVSEVTGSK